MSLLKLFKNLRIMPVVALAALSLSTISSTAHARWDTCDSILNAGISFFQKSPPLDLNIQKIKLPMADRPNKSETFYVSENKTAAAQLDQLSIKSISTGGLLFCVAVLVYDSDSQVGLVSHWVTADQNQPAIQWYIKNIKNIFGRTGGDWSNAKVTLVQGHQTSKEDRKTYYRLANAISNSAPDSVHVDVKSQGSHARAVQLDLEDGTVTEFIQDSSEFSSDKSAQQIIQIQNVN